jgi:predicted amidophosphoribosyltransferase
MARLRYPVTTVVYGAVMRGLVELVAPVRCGACGEVGEELCERCARDVAVLGPPWCRRCGTPGDASPCPACSGLGGFARARSLVAFVEPARRLTLDLKRRGRRRLAGAIGELLASLAEREGIEVADAVTWVPGGRSTIRAGYDHTRLLATATAAALGLPALGLLRRAAEGPRQADVPLERRRSNVRGRFVVTGAAGSAPVVLLVDDVFTTGATAEACSMALTSAGATSVDVITWARTLRSRAPGPPGTTAILST